MPKTPVVLSDFQEYFLTPPVAQNKLNHYLAYLMASANCITNSINSVTEANRIHEIMREKVDKYALSPEQIQSRQYNLMPTHMYPDLSTAVVSTKAHNLATIEMENESSSSATVTTPPNITRNISEVQSRFPQTHSNFLQTPCGLGINKRMYLFENAVMKILQQAYVIQESLPNSIIHATCSGYLSPSPIQTYLSQKKWLKTQVLHAYHMGCYAAIPAAQMAVGVVSASYNSLAKPYTKVDVLHSEMISVHLNVVDDSPGNIVNMSLFADGFIKYSASSESEFIKQNTRGLKVLAIDTMLINNSLDEMTWVPASFQFDLFLSKNVPLFIGDTMHDFMKQLCKQINLDFDKCKDEIHYALHPGGPKILKFIQDTLRLAEDKITFSQNVFYRLGNMSSATLPHIWSDIIKSNKVKPGEKIMTVAFGPGLTATGLILEKI